jgi:hypothetical protein
MSTDVNEMTVEDLVGIYVKVRDAREENEAAFKEKDSEFQEQLEILSARILEICNEQEADSIKTKAGTVTRRVTTRYWTSDWDSMYQFIQEHDAPFLLEKRIHGGNMKEFLQENPDVLPMGLQVDSKYTVVVRRSKS